MRDLEICEGGMDLLSSTYVLEGEAGRNWLILVI